MKRYIVIDGAGCLSFEGTFNDLKEYVTDRFGNAKNFFKYNTVYETTGKLVELEL